MYRGREQHDAVRKCQAVQCCQTPCGMETKQVWQAGLEDEGFIFQAQGRSLLGSTEVRK